MPKYRAAKFKLAGSSGTLFKLLFSSLLQTGHRIPQVQILTDYISRVNFDTCCILKWSLKQPQVELVVSRD